MRVIEIEIYDDEEVKTQQAKFMLTGSDIFWSNDIEEIVSLVRKDLRGDVE